MGTGGRDPAPVPALVRPCRACRDEPPSAPLCARASPSWRPVSPRLARRQAAGGSGEPGRDSIPGRWGRGLSPGQTLHRRSPQRPTARILGAPWCVPKGSLSGLEEVRQPGGSGAGLARKRSGAEGQEAGVRELGRRGAAPVAGGAEGPLGSGSVDRDPREQATSRGKDAVVFQGFGAAELPRWGQALRRTGDRERGRWPWGRAGAG